MRRVERKIAHASNLAAATQDGATPSTTGTVFTSPCQAVCALDPVVLESLSTSRTSEDVGVLADGIGRLSSRLRLLFYSDLLIFLFSLLLPTRSPAALLSF